MQNQVAIDRHGDGVFMVSTFPDVASFRRRFSHCETRDPFAQALGFASMAAAALGWPMVDRTGQIAPAMAAQLVAEQARKRGAEVVVLADRRA